ncbi:hypothetical protein SCHPADRAFT_896097 [Schizopora paradoxa]|uniref:Uncharacterized protein n=1 Tax=Schizopora paradoxa TaxID=27342 RepID=A0A0H2R1K6_9AGAM|nr:hypothetical protein SCHPADRAFT_896097 [Schizopora paradoxa]
MLYYSGYGRLTSRVYALWRTIKLALDYGALVTMENYICYIVSKIGNPDTDKLPDTSGSKNNYGFRNDTTGRMLCPCIYNWDDPSVRQGLLDCSLPVNSENHPLLAYKDCKYNEQDEEEGLFRNDAVIRLAKLIFTSPSSINEDTSSKAATRKGNAQLAGLTSMTPRSIAYIHCQLRHLMSQRGSYTSQDGKFNLYEYYWMVVDAIETGDDDFKKGLMDYWNSELFGSAQGLAPAVVSRQPIEEGVKAKKNSANRLLAQREAKAAKKAAAAAADPAATAGSTSG